MGAPNASRGSRTDRWNDGATACTNMPLTEPGGMHNNPGGALLGGEAMCRSLTPQRGQQPSGYRLMPMAVLRQVSGWVGLPLLFLPHSAPATSACWNLSWTGAVPP